MQQDNLYNPELLTDRIAFFAIYMPIIRKKIFEFVRIWNVHRICKQNNCSTAVVGKPINLYEYPTKRI